MQIVDPSKIATEDEDSITIITLFYFDGVGEDEDVGGIGKDYVE
jgi:hypothetical protein